MKNPMLEPEVRAQRSLMTSMQNKLDRNRHKYTLETCWLQCTPEEMFQRAKEELVELEQAILIGNDQEIMDECADVALFAMFIHDIVERRSEIARKSKCNDAPQW